MIQTQKGFAFSTEMNSLPPKGFLHYQGGCLFIPQVEKATSEPKKFKVQAIGKRFPLRHVRPAKSAWSGLKAKDTVSRSITCGE